MAPVVVAGGLMLASALVKIAVEKLSSAITEQAKLAWYFSRDLEYMKDTMESMAAVFDDAEKQSVKSESVRLWLKRIKHAAFDISDMMDDYQDIAKTPGMLSRLKAPGKRMALANKMKKMRKRLERIQKERLAFNFSESTNPSQDQLHYNERETTSTMQEAEIIGRDAEKKEIIRILSSSNNNDGTMILPVYGLGGMGKSTLAQHVYNETQLYYEHRVWVYVSEVFDLKKIGKSVISQLPPADGGNQNLESLQTISKHLEELLLSSKKILIILDDIWQGDALELKKLKDMLYVGKKGSMVDVLVTTRSETIANRICTNKPYKLKPLADDACWAIIKRHSGFEVKSNSQNLQDIGLDIAKKCGGVALAAQVIGYMLKSKDLDGWLAVNNSDIWTESSGDEEPQHEKVLPSLKLSYERMTPRLRLCFSYCAIFPKGHNICENDLIHQWIALDFIKKTSEGKEYINQLLGMSFLQQSKLPTTSREIVTRYTMHDLVHDLARSIVGDELIIIDAANQVKTSEQKYCRYALLVNYEGQIKFPDILPKKVRALHFSSCSKMEFRDSSFSFMKRLGILDFSECSGIQLPSSIGLLKQLKCLIAPQLQDKNLPEAIGELLKLQYLNLRGSSLISKIPKSIGKLSCLIYLNLSGCSGILKIPDSISGLKSLVHLDMSNCSGITCLPGTLGNLTNLQHLDLSRCSGVVEVPESLGGLNELQHLNLSYCGSIIILPEAIGCLNKLRYLDMTYNEHINELPGSFQNLQSLVHLNLSHCRCGKGLPEALCGLTSLEHLNMSSSPFYEDELWKDIYDAMGNLTNLKYLNLYLAGKGLSSSDFIGSLTNLEHLNISTTPIVSLPEGIGNLKKLRTLDLSYCRSLKSLPDSIGEIAALKSLLVVGCSDELIEMANSMLHNSQTLCFKVQADSGSDCSNIPLLEDRNVNKLMVYSLENVRSPEEARTVKLSEKDKLCDLELSWTHENVDRFVEDKDLLGILVPPGGLKVLGLHNYRGQSFPNWFVDISHHLPNLVVIWLDTLPEIRSLPPLGQLPNLEDLRIFNCHSVTRIGQDFYGGKRAFSRLSRFFMSGMNGLEKWCATYTLDDGVEEFMFPVLDKLAVASCPRLRLTSRLPVCRDCRIQESDGILSSLEELGNKIGYLTKLRICISHDKNLNLFQQITALHELEISLCYNLTSLPESMRHLTFLRSLTLDSCESISSLPEWLADLSSLRSLTIWDCEGIKSLPACIQKLKALQKLRIQWNPKLKRWCESAENKKLLAHIKRIIYEGCDHEPMTESDSDKISELPTELENEIKESNETE